MQKICPQTEPSYVPGGKVPVELSTTVFFHGKHHGAKLVVPPNITVEGRN